jgi:hypothetical protein
MMNGTRAYLETYPGVSQAAAEANSSRLLRNDKVRTAINEELSKIWVDKDGDTARSNTYAMIRAVAMSNIFDVLNIEDGKITVKSLDEIPEFVKHAVMSMDCIERVTEHGVERRISVRMHPKIAALELCAKIQGMFNSNEPKPVEIVIKKAIRPDRKPERKTYEEESL